MSIATLLNTTWKFNDTLTFDPAAYIAFIVNTEDESGGTHRVFMVNGDNEKIYYKMPLDFDEGLIAYENGAWKNPAYQTLTFLSGSDLEDADLISFVEANATQITEKHYLDLDGLEYYHNTKVVPTIEAMIRSIVAEMKNDGEI